MKTVFSRTMIAIIAFGLLFWACSSPQPSFTVEKSGIFQASIMNPTEYRDPYRDVALYAIFTGPDGEQTEFYGFYDDTDTWRIRFMPDQAGTWTYEAQFSDGSESLTGTFECVESDNPGITTMDRSNPIWFGYSGGDHETVHSFHVGDRFFAENWSDSARTTFLNWAQAQGYNTLSIASHLLNRPVQRRGLSWDTPDLWDSENRHPNPAEYRKMEAILDTLSQRKMLVYQFAGFFGQSSDFPLNPEHQELYLRYTLARIAPYWNLLFNVAGPEPNIKADEFRNAMDRDDVDRLGRMIHQQDPFGHLISVHTSPGAGDMFPDANWSGYATLQGAKGTDWGRINRYVLENHTGSKPVYAQEMFWPGNNLHHVSDPGNIRRKAYVLLFSASTINFGDMDGNSSSGFSGSMHLPDRHQEWHDIVKTAWDWFETVPYYRTKPRQDLVTRGFCLAQEDSLYMIYYPEIRNTGSLNLSSAAGEYTGIWYDPVSGQGTGTSTIISGGEKFQPVPPGMLSEDGILIVQRRG